MSTAAALPTSATTQPSRAARLLDLVRKLIDYGKELAATLRQPGAATDLPATARRFGTADIALIIARISHGLLLAGALQERLVRCGARLDVLPRQRGTQAAPKPPRPPRSHPAPQAAPDLTQLPTPEQIAAEVRRRPIGAVLADICRDLGIRPNHPLWRELQWAIIRYDGNYARLVIEMLRQVFPYPVPPGFFPPAELPACTGPP